MTPKLRLILASVFFLGWIGYLAYLVSITRQPVILSRPQFLVANAYVVAQLDEVHDSDHPKREIKILEIPWADEADLKKLAETTISVKGLEKCEMANGWVGAGTYIVPLTKDKGGFYLTEIPPSPGFFVDVAHNNDLRIYHADAQALEQLKDLIADFHSK